MKKREPRSPESAFSSLGVSTRSSIQVFSCPSFQNLTVRGQLASARTPPTKVRPCPESRSLSQDVKLVWVASILLLPGLASAGEPLHQRIDRLILAKAGGKPVGAVADDAEFLRRVHLDLAGRIPSVEQTRAFLQDTSADKRARVIDQLLAGPDYARRMQEAFHVVLMERLGDHPEWTKYLHSSFEANKPWDQMVREILRASPKNDAAKGAAFFYAKRLENYGQNAVDYSGLTRDVGRLFLGMDLAVRPVPQSPLHQGLQAGGLPGPLCHFPERVPC